MSSSRGWGGAICMSDPLLDNFWEILLDDDDQDDVSTRSLFFPRAKSKEENNIVDYIIPAALEESVERAMDSVLLPPPRIKKRSLQPHVWMQNASLNREKPYVSKPTSTAIKKKKTSDTKEYPSWFKSGSSSEPKRSSRMERLYCMRGL